MLNNLPSRTPAVTLTSCTIAISPPNSGALITATSFTTIAARLPASNITPGSGSRLLPEFAEKHKGLLLDAKSNKKKTRQEKKWSFCFL